MEEKIMKKNGMYYVIVRGKYSGVFAGFLKATEGSTCELHESIRIWKWEGAASISQIAMEGVKIPENCKFAIAVPIHWIYDVIEIIPTTQTAFDNIRNVPKWTV
jgi:hypothetical protein